MSGAGSASGMPELDMRAELARIDRDRAETQKLMAESRRLDGERTISSELFVAEREKFIAERQKLLAEALKLERERWLAPALAFTALLGGLLGAGSFIAVLIRGVH